MVKQERGAKGNYVREEGKRGAGNGVSGKLEGMFLMRIHGHENR